MPVCTRRATRRDAAGRVHEAEPNWASEVPWHRAVENTGHGHGHGHAAVASGALSEPP